MATEGGIHNNTMMEREAAHIMIVAHAGTLYQSLARTLQEQLRGCQALICEAGATIADSDGDIRLILVHAGCGTGIAREIEAQRALHPSAVIAILVDDTEMPAHCCELFAAQKVQGILPMTLKLEVWLAAVLLLLSGGEYYPVVNRRNALPAVAPPPAPQIAPPRPEIVEAAPAAGARPATPPLCSLTAREQEILELLSEGHQNKLIAHRMSLSEHTVKVHVHNLLSKLRVSNRTQAAATYRRGLAGAPGIAAPMAARGAGGAGAAPTP
ncbi:MAG TPA: response regulator transcription factor [Aquamicrobium sp.]|nr:response regulator transcription factor [Aquamicrobium sp.]